MAVKTSSGLGVYGCKTISFMVIIIAAYINNIFCQWMLSHRPGYALRTHNWDFSGNTTDVSNQNKINGKEMNSNAFGFAEYVLWFFFSFWCAHK